MNQTRLQVQSKFSQAAKRQITKLGLGPTPACQQLVEKMIAIGVSRLENQHLLEREELIIQSQESLRKCMVELGDRAVVLGTFPVADEDAFKQMQKKLSPMWPFC